MFCQRSSIIYMWAYQTILGPYLSYFDKRFSWVNHYYPVQLLILTTCALYLLYHRCMILPKSLFVRQSIKVINNVLYAYNGKIVVWFTEDENERTPTPPLLFIIENEGCQKTSTSFPLGISIGLFFSLIKGKHHRR